MLSAVENNASSALRWNSGCCDDDAISAGTSSRQSWAHAHHTRILNRHHPGFNRELYYLNQNCRCNRTVYRHHDVDRTWIAWRRSGAIADSKRIRATGAAPRADDQLLSLRDSEAAAFYICPRHQGHRGGGSESQWTTEAVQKYPRRFHRRPLIERNLMVENHWGAPQTATHRRPSENLVRLRQLDYQGVASKMPLPW